MEDPIFIVLERRRSQEDASVQNLIQQAVTAWLTKELTK